MFIAFNELCRIDKIHFLHSTPLYVWAIVQDISKQQNIEQNERLAIFNAIKMQLHLIPSSVYLFSCFHFKCISHWIRALLWCYVRCTCTTLTNTNTFSSSFCNNIFLLPPLFILSVKMEPLLKISFRCTHRLVFVINYLNYFIQRIVDVNE